MSVTLHIVKASLTFNALLNGRTVKVAVAPFAAMAQDYDREVFDYDKKQYVKSDTTKSCDIKFAAIQRRIEQGFNADFVLINSGGKELDGHQVYVYNKGANSYYDIDMGDQYRPLVGLLVKVGKNYEIIPAGVPVHTWIKENHPNAYQDWNSKHGVYQRINAHYKATVHCIGDLERYINAEPDQVDLSLFEGTAVEKRNAPWWMVEGIESLKREYVKKRRGNLEPQK